MTHDCSCTLLRQAARRTSSIYDEALLPLGINVAQFSLLRRLNRAGMLSLTELARMVELDRSTVGRNAKVLERMGFIEAGNGQDHRESNLRLSEKGLDILALGAPLWDKAQADIEAKLGRDGVEHLQALLKAL